MKNKNLKQNKGGLILKRTEIESLLNTADTLGVAFGLDRPGYAPDVNLKVYRVYQGVNELLGEEVSMKYKKGAAEVGGSRLECENFTFQFLNNLKLNGFDFAYLKKSEFADLFETGYEEEIFIAGALKKYGQVSTITEDWFTLSVAPNSKIRPNLKESSVDKSLFNPPRFKLMDGCPPIWDAIPPSVSEGITLDKIKFRESEVVVN